MHSILFIHPTGISDLIQTLSDNKQVEFLSIKGIPITKEVVTYLQTCFKLKRLILEECSNISPTIFTLHRLIELYVDTPISFTQEYFTGLLSLLQCKLKRIHMIPTGPLRKEQIRLLVMVAIDNNVKELMLDSFISLKL